MAAGKGTEVSKVKREPEDPALPVLLMEGICQRENLRKALQRVRQNKGSPGIDGMTVKKLPGYNPNLQTKGGSSRFSVKNYHVGVELTDDMFGIKFPKGTRVYDSIIEMGYIAGEGFWVTNEDGAVEFVRWDEPIDQALDMDTSTLGKSATQAITEGDSNDMRSTSKMVRKVCNKTNIQTKGTSLRRTKAKVVIVVSCTDVKTSCGCTAIEEPQLTLEPGQEDEFVVELILSTLGRKTSEIIIYSSAPSSPDKLTIAGTFNPEAVSSAFPMRVQLGKLSLNETVVEPLNIHTFIKNDIPVSIQHIDTRNGFVKAKLGEKAKFQYQNQTGYYLLSVSRRCSILRLLRFSTYKPLDNTFCY